MSETTGLTISIPLDKVAVGNLTNFWMQKEHSLKGLLVLQNFQSLSRKMLFHFLGLKRCLLPRNALHTLAFIAALCQNEASNKKKNHSAEKPTDNEKYAFRCFLLRLGFIGDAHKATRKILLKNLTGSSSFQETAHLQGGA